MEFLATARRDERGYERHVQGDGKENITRHRMIAALLDTADSVRVRT